VTVAQQLPGVLHPTVCVPTVPSSTAWHDAEAPVAHFYLQIPMTATQFKYVRRWKKTQNCLKVQDWKDLQLKKAKKKREKASRDLL